MNRFEGFCLIGDVHGSRTELERLLEKVPDSYQIIFLGDLIDRGSDSPGVVRIAYELSLDGRGVLVKGNHEETMLKYMGYEMSGARNEMRKPVPSRYREWREISKNPKWMKFLHESPSYYEFMPDFFAIHVGALSNKGIEDHKATVLTHLRYVDVENHGKVRHMGPDFEQPDGSVYWADVYNRECTVFFGHHILSYEMPTLKYHGNPKGGNSHYTCSMDTGCVYGGKLSAALVDSDAPYYPTFISVQSDTINSKPGSI